MTPVIYNIGMSKMDLYESAVVRFDDVCEHWKIPKVRCNPYPHPLYQRRTGSGGTIFGLYSGNEIWVNVKDSSAPVKARGRAWSYPGNKTDRTASGIAFHELGHHVYRHLSMNAPLWRAVVDGAKNEVVSGYEPVYEESFAETCRLFSSNPDLLRLACPKRYGYILQYISPWHNATWKEVLANAPDFIINNAARWAKDAS